MKVAFEALIKYVNIKSLMSGDKEAEMKLRFQPNDELITNINKLHQPDDTVFVVIMDRKEASEKEGV